MRLIPKDWNELQQYKDRKPLWIKLHRDLLNNFSYSSVQIGTKATLPLLWLLACEYEDGIIDATLEEISFRIHIDKKTIDKAIKELVECNFFVLDGECTEVYETVPREETEKRRDREKEEIEYFDEFWKSYPKKKSKQDALKAFKKVYKKLPLLDDLIYIISQNKMSDDWAKDNGKFIPYPASWLNAKRWTDEVSPPIQDKIELSLSNNIFDAIDEHSTNQGLLNG